MNNKKRSFYGNNKHRNRQRPTTEHISINKVYDSNGPSGRQRGNASTLYDKYIVLGRDASLSGDRILSENLMQHAEHYLRIVNSIQEQMQSSYVDRIPTHEEQKYPSNFHHDEEPSKLPLEVECGFEKQDRQQQEVISVDKINDAPPKQILRRRTYPFAKRKPNIIYSETPEIVEADSSHSATPINQEEIVGVSTQEKEMLYSKPKRIPKKRTISKITYNDDISKNNFETE